MIAKKNSRLNLEKKRVVLFQIGLLTAGSFTLAAFAWKTPQASMNDVEYVALSNQTTTVEYRPVDKPEPEEIKIPEPEPIDDPQVNAASSADITEKMEKSKNTKKVQDPTVNPQGILPPGPGIIIPDVVIDPEEIDPWPPIQAEYIGGHPAMVKRILNELVYPEIDIELGNQGKVYLSFVVEKDGSLTNVKIERGVTSTINREAKRIVKNFPKWKPAENMNGKVRTIVRLPINFLLE